MIHPLSTQKDFDRYLAALVAWHSTNRGNFSTDQLINAPKFNYLVDQMRSSKMHFEKLRSVATSTNKTKVHAKTLNVFMRFGVRLLSVLETARRADRQLSGPDAEALAKAINRIESCEESFTVRPETGATGKVRDVHRFGLVRRSQQRTLSWLVDALIAPSCFDFALPGRRGVHGAAKTIGEHALSGLRFWIVTDVQSAFPAVSAQHVRELVGLHPSLVSHVVYPHKHPTKQAVSPGLPTGGVHSSRILSVLVGRELQHICCGNTVAVAYSDNIAIGAHTMDEAKCAHQALQNRMTHLTAGPLYLHDTKLCDAHNHQGYCQQEDWTCQGAVDFCGYRISADMPTEQIRYRPNRLSFSRCHDRLLRKLQYVPDQELDEFACESVHRWAKNFPLWKRNEESETFLGRHIDDISHVERMRRIKRAQ